LAIRPWQHVLEPLTGYLLLGAKLATDPLKFSEAFNFGPHAGDTLQVKELVDNAINVWGQGKAKIVNDSSQVHEAGILKLDNTKAIEQLGWQPRLSAYEAITKTIEWYKKYNAQPIKQLTFDQIEIYLSLL
jgi:CDP-glucose 4,6-dehydratase